ncbi:Thiamine-binding periplasmic protein precursor [Raoultella terrigena]|uniref:Thiamine-binding periplasmic protein n=1 Tax=Raoultella terrigena TaxID=577 RepID=A0A485B0T7_RAOTE|nr:Thiamine-binding periplasmic protein precursor [Raoultella terrigena]
MLSYTTSPAYHIIEEKKDNYAAAGFSEGHYLQVEVAARTAASKQPELAEKFLKFMVSPGFQNAIPAGNWMYPVTQVTLPAGFDTLIKPQTTLEFTPQQVAGERQNWINAWQRAVSR